MFLKDVERLVRTLVAQKLAHDYIRHYLQETYQLDDKSIDEVFAKLGIGPDRGGSGKAPPKGWDAGAAKVAKKGFF